MAFVWTSVSAGKVAITTHVNEAKDNVDTLADNLGVAHYGWTEMPVSGDEMVEQPQIQDLQDATDYVDSVNTCSSENAGHDVGEDTGEDSTVHGTQDSAIYSGADVVVDAGHHTGVDSAQDTGIDATANATVYASKDTTVYSGRNTGINATAEVSEKETNYTDVY